MVRNATQNILHQRFRSWRLLAMVVLIGAALVVSTDHSVAQPPVDHVKTDTSITLSWEVDGEMTFYWYQPKLRKAEVVIVKNAKTRTFTNLQPESKHTFIFFGLLHGRIYVTTNATNTPPPTPEVSIAAGAGVVEGSDATFTLTATPAPTQSISVNVSPLQSGDFGVASAVKNVTITTSGTATVTFSTTGDSIDEPDGSVTASIVSGTGYTSSTTNGSATVAIADNDVPELSIASNGDVTEGTAASFTINASPTPHTALSVDVGVSASGSFGVTAGTQTITVPTSGSKTFTVSTSGDSTDEPDGSVTATLNTGTGYTVLSSASSATATISDDDVPPTPDPEVSITAGSAITEGSDATFTISVSPTQSATLDVSVTVSQTGAYASTGQQTVTIPTSGSYTLTVSTTNDSTDEPDGSVVATIDSGTGYTVSSSNGQGTVAVSDDDDPPQPAAQQQSPQDQIQHCLTGNILQTVRGYYDSNKNKSPNYGKNWKRVLITFHDVSDENLTPYTAAEALQSETIWFGWKPVREAIQCIELVFPAPSADPEISITGSADVTEGSSVSFTVTATPAPSANLDVSVNVTQSGTFTTQTGADTVTIGATGSTAFAISTDNDTTDEPDGSVTATLNTGTGYTVSSSAGAATVNVADDDDAPDKQQNATPTITIGDATAAEGDSLTFTVSVSPTHSSAITLDYETVDGTAISHSLVNDYTAASGTVTIPAGDSSATITIATTEDSNIEINDEFTVVISNPPTGVTIGDDTATGTITNDDSGDTGDPLHSVFKFVQIENDPGVGAVGVWEGGQARVWRVKLTHQPPTTITFQVLLRDHRDGRILSVSPPYLVFTTSNWNQFQNVTVQYMESWGRKFRLANVYLAAVEYPGYTSYTDLQVSMYDTSESFPITQVKPQPNLLTEGSTTSSLTYQLKLGAKPRDPTEVTVSNPDPGAVTVSPTTLTFTHENYNEFQEVTVTPLTDADSLDEFVEITVRIPVPYYDQQFEIAETFAAVVEEPASPGVLVDPKALTLDEGNTGQYDVWVRTDPGNGKSVTVTPTFTGSDITVSPTILTFTGGSNGNWKTKQTVTVSSAMDEDPDNENVTISHVISGNGDGYNAQTLSQSVSVVVWDDESKVEIEFDRDVLVLNEGDGSGVQLKVRLTNDPGPAGGAKNRVLVTTLPTSNRTYFLVSPDNLHFTTGPDGNWNEWQTFTFTPSSSNVDDGNTTHDRTRRYVVLGQVPIQNLPGYPDTVNDKVTKPIDFFYFDDEITGALTLEHSSLTVHEQGGPITYKLKLNSDPGGPVTVTIANPDDTKLKISPETVTFPYGGPGDWHIQEVTITPIVDDDAIDQTLNIVHTYDGFGSTNQQQTLALTIKDPGEQLKLVYDTDDIYIEEQYGADVSGLTESQFDVLREGKFLPWSVLPRTAIPTDSHPTGSITHFCMKLNRDPEAHVRVVLPAVHLTDGQGGTDTTKVQFLLDHPIGVKQPSRYWYDFTSDNWNEQVCFVVTAGDDSKISHVDAQVTPTIERIWYPDPGRQPSQTPASGISVEAPSFRVRVFDNLWNRIHMYPRGGGSTVNLTEGGASKKIRLEMVNVNFSNATLKVNIPDEHKDAIRVTPSTVSGFPAWRTFDWGCSKFAIYRDEYCLDVTITALPDNDQVDETIELSFTITGLDNVTAPTPNTITINVTDIASTTVDMEVGPSSLFLVEESISDDIWVRLKQDPVVEVEVAASVTTGDANKVRILPDKLTFDSSNYQTFQRLSVEALADSDSSDDTVTLTIAGTGTGLVIGDHTVEAEIIDDD